MLNVLGFKKLNFVFEGNNLGLTTDVAFLPPRKFLHSQLHFTVGVFVNHNPVSDASETMPRAVTPIWF